MSLRLVWIFCLIAVGAAGTLSFMEQRNIYSETSSSETTSNTPNVSFENIEMTINSSAGLPQYELSAPKYWHYNLEQRSEFESPDIVIHNENGSKIYATSEKGETHDESEVITLIGDVKIKQPSIDTELEPLNIFTEKLTVSQKTQLVTTDLPIIAVRGSEKVTANGMTLHLNDEILHLHSNVRARYNP